MNNREDIVNPIGYAAEEMIACKLCGKQSAPSRTSCFYCGKPFDPDDVCLETTKINLAKLDGFEIGFNLVIKPSATEVQSAEVKIIAQMLGHEDEFLRKFFDANEALPAVRLTSAVDAAVVSRKLSNFGIESEIVCDESFRLAEPTQRLRGLFFDNDRITLIVFNTGETIEFLVEDLVLIVSGSIYEKKIESIETYAKTKEYKPVSIDETAKDVKVIDIYSRSSFTGFRIFTHGFDFSCLGDEMTFLANENINKLFFRLSKIGPNVIRIESYDRIRNLLGSVWEIEAVNDSRSLEKKGVGKFTVNRATKYSNLGQFTKYSRFQRHLI